MIPLGVLASSHVAPAGGSGSFDFLSTHSSDANASSYTFSGVDIGTAATDRVVIVYVSFQNASATISGVTIGGVTATIDVQGGGTNGNNRNGWARAVVPTGTTADIVVTAINAVPKSCGIGVYRSAGYTVTLSDTLNVPGATPLSLSGDITAIAGGVILAGATWRDYSTTATWTGVTEDWDLQQQGAEVHTWSGGHALTPTGGDVTITVQYAFSGYYPGMTAVAYTLS